MDCVSRVRIQFNMCLWIVLLLDPFLQLWDALTTANGLSRILLLGLFWNHGQETIPSSIIFPFLYFGASGKLETCPFLMILDLLRVSLST